MLRRLLEWDEPAEEESIRNISKIYIYINKSNPFFIFKTSSSDR